MIHPAGEPGRTILVANDHEWTARSLDTILGAEGYSVVRAFTAAQALERATAVRPDAFVLDVQLPDQDGMSLCRAIRNEPCLGPAIPVLLTTAGPSGRQERLAAYRAGAWEFFGQPLDGEALLLKLAVFLEAKSVADGLRDGNLIDSRTGLYNRMGLTVRGRELASVAARRRQPLACLALRPALPDLEAALATAEEVARNVAAVLRSAGRSADAIGRLGMLEFAVIASGTGPGEIRHLVRRLNEVAAASSLRSVVGESGSVFRAAVSAVENAAEPRVDPTELIDQAERAVRDLDGEALIVSSGR